MSQNSEGGGAMGIAWGMLVATIVVIGILVWLGAKLF